MHGTDRRMGIRLQDAGTGAAALKILRKHFPNLPLSKLKHRITAREPVFSCDGTIDGRRVLVRLEKDLARAGLQTELYEEWIGRDGTRKTVPLPDESLLNALRRYGKSPGRLTGKSARRRTPDRRYPQAAYRRQGALYDGTGKDAGGPAL